MSTKPADPEAVTLTEIEAGVRAECFLTTNTRLSATGSATVTEASLCDSASAQTPATRQWEGSFEVFRDLDPDTGLPVAGGEPVLDVLDSFNEKFWALRARGPLYTEPFAAGQPYKLFEVVPDAGQDPSSREGNFKEVFPVFIHNEWKGEVAA